MTAIARVDDLIVDYLINDARLLTTMLPMTRMPMTITIFSLRVRFGR